MEDELIEHFTVLKKASYTLMDKFLTDTRSPGTGLKFSHIKAVAAFQEDQSYTVKELAANGMIKLPNMSLMIDDLIKHGFARKKRDQTDRRRVVVTLTVEGKKIRDKFISNRRKVVSSMLSKLDKSKQEELLCSIDKLAAILQEIAK